jgi:hypothetical protein
MNWSSRTCRVDDCRGAAKTLPAPSRQPLHRRPIIHRRSIVTRARVCLRQACRAALRRTRTIAEAVFCNEIRRWKAIEPLMASRMLLLRRENQSVAASRSVPVPPHSGGTRPRDGVGSGDATDESARRMDYGTPTGLLGEPGCSGNSSERLRAPSVTSGNRLTVCMASPPR